MSKIKMLVPQYVKDFICIGTECEDTCCRDWIITVDKKTHQKYKKLGKKEFNPLANKDIVLNKDRTGVHDYASICLKENGYCPFLGRDGLCGVYQKLSYDYMPLTCRAYPRTTHLIDDVLEMGLLLSCPEAARKALLPQEIMEFEFVEMEMEEYMKWKNEFFYTKGENAKKEEHKYFWDIRMAAIDILQNRRFTIVERLMLLGMMYKRIEKCVDAEDYENISVQIDEFMNLVEIVNPRELFADMEENKAIQLFVFKLISDKSIITRKKGLSKNLRDLITGAQKVFEASVEDVFLNTDILDLYKSILKERVNPFIEEYSHIFEHYFVNLYFVQLLPFGISEEGIWNSLIYLCMQFAVIKTLMIGNFYNKNRITEEDMVEIIYLLTRNYEHSQQYKDMILRLNEVLELDTLGGLYVLIHD